MTEEEVSDGHYLLVWFSQRPIAPANLVPVRRAIEDMVTEPREEVTIDVWLESPGGDAHTAYKLALLLRHYAGTVRVVVPDYAKSAATLLALAGHEIYLAPSAELGPLDAQLPEEGSLEGYISALSIARASDEIAREAVELAGRGGAELLNLTGLTRAHTFDAMLTFSARFSEPLVRQLDPKSVHNAKQMLRVTQRYATSLLSACMEESRAAHMAAHLVENFPSHGFVISMRDAERISLPVKPLADYQFAEQVRAIHRIAEDDQEPTVSFVKMREVLNAGEEGEDSEPTQEDTGVSSTAETAEASEADGLDATIHKIAGGD